MVLVLTDMMALSSLRWNDVITILHLSWLKPYWSSVFLTECGMEEATSERNIVTLVTVALLQLNAQNVTLVSCL